MNYKKWCDNNSDVIATTLNLLLIIGIIWTMLAATFSNVPSLLFPKDSKNDIMIPSYGIKCTGGYDFTGNLTEALSKGICTYYNITTIYDLNEPININADVRTEKIPAIIP
ncbi:MAG: hypothetical protein V1709_03490 [Planctomycetota bacterium]